MLRLTGAMGRRGGVDNLFLSRDSRGRGERSGCIILFFAHFLARSIDLCLLMLLPLLLVSGGSNGGLSGAGTTRCKWCSGYRALVLCPSMGFFCLRHRHRERWEGAWVGVLITQRLLLTIEGGGK